MIGLVYFGFITIFVRKFHFKYVYGLILPLLIFLFFFVTTIYIGQVTSGWEGLAYLILMILALCILIGYLSGWLFVALVKRLKK
jgi:NhaP-type Na+/H+ or K+/H+ antiporter